MTFADSLPVIILILAVLGIFALPVIEKIRTRGMTPREIYEFYKKNNRYFVSGSNLEKLEEYCFSKEMRCSGEKVPAHIRKKFPGRRVVTTMHLPRVPSPLSPTPRPGT